MNGNACTVEEIHARVERQVALIDRARNMTRGVPSMVTSR